MLDHESRLGDAAVVVAMIPVVVVQMPGDQVVGVIAMGNRLVPTGRAVAMGAIVPAAIMACRAAVRVRGAHRHPMVVDVAGVHVVEVTAMEVVRMVGVLHGGMTASGAVLVAIVVLVLVAVHLVTAFHP
ncbi:MAG TPA: hypothetical protein VMT03_16405 [Polyangia bacterium]|nr:hypothetical protein [Polyangia bacterium]